MNFGRIEFCVLFVCNRGDSAHAVSLNAGGMRERGREIFAYVCMLGGADSVRGAI